VLGTPPFNLILLTASRKCFGFSGPVSSHSFITSSARTQHTWWYNLQLSCRTESCSLSVYNTYNAVKNQTRYISRNCNKYDPVSTTFSIGNCHESPNIFQKSFKIVFFKPLSSVHSSALYPLSTAQTHFFHYCCQLAWE